MRIDGSIKTITGGVSTLDDKRHSGQYAKQVDNFRCDSQRGLVKRPASEAIGPLIDSFNPDTDVAFPFLSRGELFWCVVAPTNLRVFDEIGTEMDTVSPIPTDYFNTLQGPDTFAFTSIEDTVYMVNKLVEVEKTTLTEEFVKNSMIVILQAPLSFTTYEIIWTGSDGVQHRVEHPVPDGLPPDGEDIGTNTMAQAIADAMAPTVAAGDELFVQGSTVLYVRADGEYADITATDGQNDAGIVALNDETYSVNNLPKYAAVNSLLTIRPDPTSDRGQFYMKSYPYVLSSDAQVQLRAGGHIPNYPLFRETLKAELNVEPVAIVTSGYREWLGGFFRERGWWQTGTLQPPDTYPVGSISGDWNGVPIAIAGTTGTVENDIDQEQEDMKAWVFIIDALRNPDNITWMLVVNRVTGAVVFDGPVEGARDFNEEFTVWWGNAQRFLGMEEGQEYDIYDEFVEGIYGQLPEVVWRESTAPNQSKQINSSTFVHALTRIGDTEFAWGPMSAGMPSQVGTLRTREAGDDDTNPFPEFIDRTINDLGRFQDRLVVLSGESVNMSITNRPYAWFRETATQQLAIDPISMKSNAQGATDLQYIVNHNNDALLFSPEAQYKLVGSLAMTSQNAALPQTTSYFSAGTAKPVSNASDVFFPIFYSTTHSGLSQYQVDKVADSQDIALHVTLHVQNYIQGNIKLIAASSTLHMVFVVTREDPDILYVYEYNDSRREPQNAWSRWRFGADINIQNMMVLEDRLFLVAEWQGYLTILRLFFNESELRASPGLEPLLLDARVRNADTNTSVPLHPGYPQDSSLKVFQGVGSPNPGAEITGWSFQGNSIVLPSDMGGGDVWYGYPYRASFIPSRRWIRDDSGVAQTASKFRITDYFMWAYGTDINVDILDAPESWPTQSFTNTDISNDALHRVSFKQRHDEADIEIWSDTVHNLAISQIEWRGTYIKVGRRF